MADSLFHITYDYVKNNPKKSAAEISKATGVMEVTVQRHLTCGRAKNKSPIFQRVKITRNLRHHDGIMRGSYCFLYSINQNYDPAKSVIFDVQQNHVKFVRDPITAALFGNVA
jgi:hypothetical protein